MISPNYTTKQVRHSPKTGIYTNKLDYLEYKQRKLRRQAYIKKQQAQVLKKFAIILISALIMLVIASKLSYRYVYLPLKNQRLNLAADVNFFHSSEAMLTNLSFLGHKHLLKDPQIPLSKSLMSQIPLANELHGLKAELMPIVTSNPDYRAGIFIWDSQTHNYVSINGKEAFSTASIIKIPVLIELFRRIDKGLVSLDTEVPFSMYHLAEGSGELQYSPLDKYHSIDSLAQIMIQHSDNSATNILLDQIGGSFVLNKIMTSWGIKKGKIENWLPDLSGDNYMSPKDFALMLYNIQNPKFLSHSSANKIIEYMSNIRNRNLINAGIPSGATIAHKTGDIGKMVGDAAIVTLPNGRKIIMVAMIERPWNSYLAKDMIREASRVTFRYFSAN